MDNLEPLRLLHCKVNPGGWVVKMQYGKFKMNELPFILGF